jgi:hypothetical protein
VRKLYLSNLALEASNNQKNLNANQIYKETGASPNQVTDKRTTTDKYAGDVGMKQLVKDTIAGADFMNAIEAGQVVDKLNAEDIDFFLKYKSFILTDFKGRGVPAKVFVDYLHRLREKQETNAGVEFGLADNTSQALLETISNLAIDAEKDKQFGKLVEALRTGTNAIPALRRLSGVLQKSYKDYMKNALTDAELDVLDEAQAAGNPNVEPIQQLLGQVNQSRPVMNQIQELATPLLALKQAGEQGDGAALQQYVDRGRELIDLITPPPDTAETMREVRRSIAQLREELSATKKMNKDIEDERARAEAIDIPAQEKIREQQRLGRILGPRLAAEQQARAAALAAAEAAALADAPELAAADAAAPGVRPPPPPLPPRTKLAASGDPARQADLSEAAQSFILREFNEDDPDILAGLIQAKKGEGFMPFDSVTNEDVGNAYDKGIGALKSLIINAVYNYEKKKGNLKSQQGEAKADELPEGKGLRGCGIGRRKKSAAERSTGYKKTTPYKQLGRYLVNHHKLNDGILMIKSPSGAAVKQLPTQSVSSNYADALHYITGGHTPPLDLFDRLSKEEKAHLHQVIKHSRVEGVGVPNPHKEDNEKEMNRFHILKGEIIAGNDSSQIAREFKGLLIKLMRQGRVPRREGNEILEELLHLGH